MSFLDNEVTSLTFFQGFLYWPIFISLYLSIFCNTLWFEWGFIWPFICFQGCPAARLFLINIFARPARSIRSKRHNQSMGERYCQLLAQAEGQLFSYITARQGWIVWGGNLLSQDNFSPYNPELISNVEISRLGWYLTRRIIFERPLSYTHWLYLLRLQARVSDLHCAEWLRA